MKRHEPVTPWTERFYFGPFALLFLLLAGLAGCSWGYPITCSPTWWTSCGGRPEPAPPTPAAQPAPVEQPTQREG